LSFFRTSKSPFKQRLDFVEPSGELQAILCPAYDFVEPSGELQAILRPASDFVEPQEEQEPLLERFLFFHKQKRQPFG
jgi:hypothetical protein